MAFEFLLLQAEFLLNGADGVLKELRPFGIGEREPVRIALPHAPNARIDERLLSLSVGRGFAVRLEFLRLRRRQRQSDGSETGDLQAGVRRAVATGHTERTGTVDLLDRRMELFRYGVDHGML